MICREVHTPEDELYRYGSHPIPEEWLTDKPVGFKGDGTEDRHEGATHRRGLQGRPGCLAARATRRFRAGHGSARKQAAIRDDDIVTLHVPMAFRKRGGRKMVVMPEGAPWVSRPRVDDAIVKAVVRAFGWQRMLDEGV